MFAQALFASYNQQMVSYLTQASYLAEQIPDLVSFVEYNTLATIYASSGDMFQADPLYRKAIDVSPNNSYKGLATASYAQFSFTQRRFEDGRRSFENALSLLAGSDNFARYNAGQTYMRWALCELNAAHRESRANELFDSAQNEFNGIDVVVSREEALRYLEAIRRQPAGASAVSVPTSLTRPPDLTGTGFVGQPGQSKMGIDDQQPPKSTAS